MISLDPTSSVYRVNFKHVFLHFVHGLSNFSCIPTWDKAGLVFSLRFSSFPAKSSSSFHFCSLLFHDQVLQYSNCTSVRDLRTSSTSVLSIFFFLVSILFSKGFCLITCLWSCPSTIFPAAPNIQEADCSEALLVLQPVSLYGLVNFA